MNFEKGRKFVQTSSVSMYTRKPFELNEKTYRNQNKYSRTIQVDVLKITSHIWGINSLKQSTCNVFSMPSSFLFAGYQAFFTSFRMNILMPSCTCRANRVLCTEENQVFGCIYECHLSKRFKTQIVPWRNGTFFTQFPKIDEES